MAQNHAVSDMLIQLLLDQKQPSPAQNVRPGIGMRPDPARPRLENPDGSFSTEETITVPRGDRWYNVPTIIGGKRYDPGDVEYWFSSGVDGVPHVGEFSSQQEAVRAARTRTDYLGRKGR